MLKINDLLKKKKEKLENKSSWINTELKKTIDNLLSKGGEKHVKSKDFKVKLNRKTLTIAVSNHYLAQSFYFKKKQIEKEIKDANNLDISDIVIKVE